MKFRSLAVAAALLVSSAAFAQSLDYETERVREADGRRGPPPEAVDACDGKASGDSCMFEGRDGSVEGACRYGPREEGVLACVPSGRPSHSPRRPRPDDEKGE